MSHLLFLKQKLALLALVFTAFCLKSQDNSFVSFGIEDGLIMSQIETLAQDDEGNLWIGTIGGLSKYNGISFINYTQKDGLAEDWITVSHKSKNGHIWFGHWGGGVSVYLPKEKKFADQKFENHSQYRLISAIAEDHTGNIWFGTENGGIFYYNVSTQKVTVIEKELSINFISCFYMDEGKNLWVGTDGGIFVFNIQSGVQPALLHHLNLENGLPSNLIRTIADPGNGEIWVGTADAGVIRLKSADIADYQTITINDGLSSNNIKKLFKDNSGVVWLGTEDAGIMQFAQGQLNTLGTKAEQKYFHVNAFLQDREGNIWLGTELGLKKYMGDLFKLYNRNYGMTGNLVWSILPDREGNLWFGTSNGVSKFSFPEIGTKKQYNSPVVKNYTTEDGLSENIIISMCEDKAGNIWLGTENNGVSVLSPEGETIKTFSRADGLPGNKIFAICEDEQGNIWLGTKKGAVKIDPKDYYSVTNFTEKDGLGGEKVYHIFSDSKGDLWFGIIGGELTKYDGQQFKTYGQAEGVSSKFILSIAEDNSSNLWFVAYGDGIIKYDGKEFKSFTIKDGLSTNSPHFIAAGKDNNIWIGVNLGIEKYNPETKRFTLYGKQQGFNGLETNENAIAHDNEGNIWFGTVRGAVKFSPEKDLPNEIEPITSISGFKVFLEKAEMPQNGSFSYNRNYFTFEALGVSLTNPKENRYQYKLEGFNSMWLPPTKERSITYSNLSHGNYVFMVRASNNSEVWNKQPVTYAFTITPPFWKTWWFYTLCGILSVLIVFIYIKIRERKLKQRQAFLEQEVARRTEELVKEKEIVEEQNRNIKESIGYAKRIQQAVLPPMEAVKKSLPESFILYQPKDIVSGDFYWVHERENKILFSVVDCTGHGVPGAFMSLIGHNLLEKIVNEKNITSPAEILQELSKEISKTLHQTDKAELKDGMDLALCCIDKTKNELEFAGAYNPLYLIRNKVIKEIKSDKIIIGKANESESIAFNNHKIDLQPNDVLYIFSDGYADQKGGPKRKKFYYQPFRKLLLDIHHLPMKEQSKKLQETVNEWKGEIEQYDDILVFGVRI